MIRKAEIKDSKKIHSLINSYASKDLMMPRSLNEIFENIRDFWVCSDKKRKVFGCVALHVIGWNDLAEIKSLAVEKRYQRQGVARELVETALGETKELGVKRVFALSYIPGFFKKFGFRIISKSKLPHKIWAECCNCPKFPDCDEIAIIKELK